MNNVIQIGKTYTLYGTFPSQYKILSRSSDDPDSYDAINVKSGWRVIIHHPKLLETGCICWAYSTHGHFEKVYLLAGEG